MPPKSQALRFGTEDPAVMKWLLSRILSEVNTAKDSFFKLEYDWKTQSQTLFIPENHTSRAYALTFTPPSDLTKTANWSIKETFRGAGFGKNMKELAQVSGPPSNNPFQEIEAAMLKAILRNIIEGKVDWKAINDDNYKGRIGQSEINMSNSYSPEKSCGLSITGINNQNTLHFPFGENTLQFDLLFIGMLKLIDSELRLKNRYNPSQPDTHARLVQEAKALLLDT